MRIAVDGQLRQVVERLATAVNRDRMLADISADDLREFHINQVGRTNRLAPRENSLTNTSCGTGLQQDFEERRRVDDDQRLILSARTAAAGVGRGCTGWRPASRV